MKSIVPTTSNFSTRCRPQQTQLLVNTMLLQLWIYVMLLKVSFGFHIIERQQHQRCFLSRHNHRLRQRCRYSMTFLYEDQQNEIVSPSVPVLQSIHHTAIKTRNITMAMSFYSLFGYCTEYKFRAGPARAVWLTLPVPYDHRSRIELIEVPSYMIRNERAPDLLLARPDILGHNHIAMDVTQQMYQQEQLQSGYANQTLPSSSTTTTTTASTNPQPQQSTPSLTTYIQQLNNTSMQRFNKSLRMALYPPQQQMIGPNIYEIAFMYDADGSLIELLHCSTSKLQQNMTSGWEPWDSTTFL